MVQTVDWMVLPPQQSAAGDAQQQHNGGHHFDRRIAGYLRRLRIPLRHGELSECEWLTEEYI